MSERSLFEHGRFLLSSGAKTNWKIECDALTRKDWLTLAMLIAERAGDFGVVDAVPMGGMALGFLLAGRANPESSRLLIVDDVYTTGASMERQRDGREAIGYVVFARNRITQPWIHALFQLDAELGRDG